MPQDPLGKQSDLQRMGFEHFQQDGSAKLMKLSSSGALSSSVSRK